MGLQTCLCIVDWIVVVKMETLSVFEFLFPLLNFTQMGFLLFYYHYSKKRNYKTFARYPDGNHSQGNVGSSSFSSQSTQRGLGVLVLDSLALSVALH